MTHKATKIVIITEKLISDGVAELIEECGASGYTVVAAGGKGSRGVRTASAASIADAFANGMEFFSTFGGSTAAAGLIPSSAPSTRSATPTPGATSAGP